MRFRPLHHHRRRLILLGGLREPEIRLSGQSVNEDAAVGDLVGLLAVENSPGGVTWTFAVTLNDYFELDGVDDTRVEVKAALNYDTNAFHLLTVQATPSVGDVIEHTFTINVNPLARAAPTFTWDDASTSDTTPPFTFGIPNGNGNYLDAKAGDTLRVYIDDAVWINHVLTAQNILDLGGSISGATPLSEGARIGKASVVRASGQESAFSATDSVTIDTTAPTLSSPSGTKTGSTTADLAVTTNEANGTLYGVVTTSSTAPTKAQVKAGQDHASAAAAFADDQAIASTGVKTFSATGLSAGTQYWSHYMHEDAVGNQSSVSTSASFTTDASSAVNITQVDHGEDSTDQTTYTFAGEALGAADAGRHIIVGVLTRDAGTTATISSVTVGGVSATQVVSRAQTSDGNLTLADLWIAAVPTGTTGDVVVTFSQAVLRCGINVWRMVGAASATASATGSSVAEDPTATITIPANGAAVGYVSAVFGGATSVSWTGLTQSLALTSVESIQYHGAAMVDSAGGGSTAITANFTGSDFGTAVGVFATWGP